METKIKTLDVNAKEWFDKINGNSYFSATITINYGMSNSKQIDLPYQYGYGDHYIDMAKQKLVKDGYIKNLDTHEALWRYCDRKNIILRTSKQKNCKKKELAV